MYLKNDVKDLKKILEIKHRKQGVSREKTEAQLILRRMKREFLKGRESIVIHMPSDRALYELVEAGVRVKKVSPFGSEMSYLLTV